MTRSDCWLWWYSLPDKAQHGLQGTLENNHQTLELDISTCLFNITFILTKQSKSYVSVVVVYKRCTSINSANFDRTTLYHRESVTMLSPVYRHCEWLHSPNILVNGGHIFSLICNERRKINILINLCFHHLFKHYWTIKEQDLRRDLLLTCSLGWFLLDTFKCFLRPTSSVSR